VENFKGKYIIEGENEKRGAKMSKSKARKFREKLAREGNRNPELSRSPFAMLDLNTRKTKTKKDKLQQVKHKKQSFGRDDFQTRDCFYFYIKAF
jgi:hypothetical protein